MFTLVVIIQVLRGIEVPASLLLAIVVLDIATMAIGYLIRMFTSK